MKATLSLGSNAPDRLERVAQTAAALADRLDIKAMTGIFVTADIHTSLLKPPMAMPPRYANAVVEAELCRPPMTSASPTLLNVELKQLELKLGRLPEHKALGLVNIDIDLVTAGGRILRPADYLRPYYLPRTLTL